MKLEKLREIMHAAPFQPFTVHVADGRSVRVPHPDFIAIMGAKTAIVTSPSEAAKPSFLLIDVPMITQLEVEGTPAAGA